jgi:hypothetical protein
VRAVWWLTIAGVWGGAVGYVFFFGTGFGVSVAYGQHPELALGTAGLMMGIIMWGWTIPLAIGLWRLRPMGKHP